MTDGRTSLFDTMRGVKLHLSPRQFLLTIFLVVLSATGSFAASQVSEVAAALVFVLGITVAGALCGLASALIAALVGFLIYNFYLTEPVLTFRLATGSDAAPLVVFNLCALVSGVLAGRLKDHAEAARVSNLQLNSLLELSRALQSALRLQDVVATVGKAAHDILGARVSLFRAEGTDLVSLDQIPHDTRWRAFAATVLSSPAPMLRDGGLLGRRLERGTGAPIAMVVEPFRPRGIEPAFVNALGNMVALTLERAALSEQMTERNASARAEELKSALLASVSHDFRTPLAAISASASSLITYGEKLDPETSMRLLRGIVDEGERLNRYTANLLEMSRLETGGGPAPLQILSVSEMVAAAVQRVRSRAGARAIMMRDRESDLLIAANPALFELVLINILDNAITYSDDGTRIRIEIARTDGLCRIAITDEGYGIPEQDAKRVFDRFYRVARSEASPRGSGLGLAIAKGFVEALGGTIGATVPGIEGRGTLITICLPLAEGTRAP
ncbi:ATP-binding protein [Sphingomonas sp. QA11]|uniref:ATP-binding protein n=1 Tax=Sphingomonas sp. QA11 TaxID=2950605 RepID=UPI00234B3686|nr:ATP-binding protein [Sphingomonas sp. QA11]WCM25124.1 ATP-binding protein [Sphingomonas sp. QA11]